MVHCTLQVTAHTLKKTHAFFNFYVGFRFTCSFSKNMGYINLHHRGLWQKIWVHVLELKAGFFFCAEHLDATLVK